MKTRFKLITFDFWNTLFHDLHEGIRHQKRISYAHGMLQPYRENLEVERVEAAFRVAHELFDAQWETRKAFTMDLHAAAMLTDLDIQISNDEKSRLVDFFESILLEYPPVMIREADTVVRFASSVALTGLVSDTGYSPGRTLRKILERNGIHDAFHAFSFSNETGYLKPNEQAFLPILSRLGVDPADAVHIGDLEETDIAGAKQLGMAAVKYIGANPKASRISVADAVIEDLHDFPEVLSQL